MKKPIQTKKTAGDENVKQLLQQIIAGFASFERDKFTLKEDHLMRTYGVKKDATEYSISISLTLDGRPPYD